MIQKVDGRVVFHTPKTRMEGEHCSPLEKLLKLALINLLVVPRTDNICAREKAKEKSSHVVSSICLGNQRRPCW